MMEKRKLLVCPGYDMSTTPVVDVFTVANIFEMVKAIGDGVPILSIENMRLLELLIKNADLFEVELVNMVGLPSADYSPAYDQIVWQLDRLSYDSMSAEIATSEMLSTVKQDEVRRFGTKAPKPKDQSQDHITEEDVSKMRIPRSVDIVGGSEDA